MNYGSYVSLRRVLLLLLYTLTMSCSRRWYILLKICMAKPKWLPNKLHADLKSLKEDIKKFITTHCNFVLEVPTFTGDTGHIKPTDILSPYSTAPLLMETIADCDAIKECTWVLATECRSIFRDMHTCLWKMAREMGTFMLNDKDTFHSDKIPNSAPMAYIMKGKSLSTEDLCYLVNSCRDELQKRKIPLLCEIYYGQW